MSESRVNAPTWLEPRQAVTSIRQLVQYQCALAEGYVHWSMAQTALALTATNPVEYLSRQAKLGAALRKQWTDRVAATISPIVEPTTPQIPSVAAVSPSPATCRAHSGRAPSGRTHPCRATGRRRLGVEPRIGRRPAEAAQGEHQIGREERGAGRTRRAAARQRVTALAVCYTHARDGRSKPHGKRQCCRAQCLQGGARELTPEDGTRAQVFAA